MRGKKAKVVRKLIYKGKDFRKRDYGRRKSNEQMVTMNLQNSKIPSERRLYQYCKKKVKNIPIKDMLKVAEKSLSV